MKDSPNFHCGAAWHLRMRTVGAGPSSYASLIAAQVQAYQDVDRSSATVLIPVVRDRKILKKLV